MRTPPPITQRMHSRTTMALGCLAALGLLACEGPPPDAAGAPGVDSIARAASSSNLTVQVSVFPHEGPDQSFIHNVSSDGNIKGYRLPVIAGKDHVITIRGSLVDLCDRVELAGAGVNDQVIPKSALDADNVDGKGQITVRIKGSDIYANDEGFRIRIRYLVEANGYDYIDCRSDRRATITALEWMGPNLPATESSPDGEIVRLEKGVQYVLRASGTNLPSTQVYDGIADEIFFQPITSVEAMASAVTVTFTPDGNAEVSAPLTKPPAVSFAHSQVGNIVGGWGPYVYYRYASSLPTAGNRTDLGRVIVGTPSVPGPVTGGIKVGIGGSPPARSDVSVVLRNTFRSGADFEFNETSSYDVCPGARGPDPRVTTIPDLTALVSNVGTADVNTPFTVQATRDGQVIATFTVPSLAAGGAPVALEIQRPENRVCATRDRQLPVICRRCGDGVLGVPVWNDRGIEVTADSANVVGEPDEVNNTATVL